MNEVDTTSCLLSPRKLIDNIFLIVFESIHNQVIIRDQFFYYKPENYPYLE